MGSGQKIGDGSCTSKKLVVQMPGEINVNVSIFSIFTVDFSREYLNMQAALQKIIGNGIGEEREFKDIFLQRGL